MPTPPFRILRFSVPASLLTEHDELDLDHLQACGHERFLRRRGARLVSVPFVGDDVYSREVYCFLRDVTEDVRVTDITDEFEFFVVTGVPEFVLRRSHVVAVTEPGPGSNERVIAILKTKAEREVAEYRLNGCKVREGSAPLLIATEAEHLPGTAGRRT